MSHHPTSHAGPPVLLMWREDDEPLTTDWPPPRWSDRVSTRTRWLIGLLVLVLVGLALLGAGAFRTTSTVRLVEVGTPAQVGPVEITAHRAIVQFDGEEYDQTITVEALCRLTEPADGSLLSNDLRRGIGMRLLNGTPIRADDRSVSFSASGYGTETRDTLTYGAPAVPCTIRGRLRQGGYRPDGYVELLLYRMDFQSNGAGLSSGWVVGRGGVHMAVPITVRATPR